MNKQIAFGVHTPVKIQNENVRGLLLKVVLGCTDVNTDPTIANLDLSAISIEANLKQHGFDYKILPGKILPLLLAQAFKETPVYKMVWPGTRAGVSLVDKGAAVKGVIMLPIPIDFGHIINLDGEDTINLDVFIEAGAKPADADQATSYVEIETIEGIGVQTYVPMWKYFGIEAGSNQEKFPLGDNVTSVTFVNLDKTTSVLADRCISSYSLKSDKLPLNESFETLVAKRCRQFDTLAEALLRYQSFCIHEGIELDGVQLMLNLNGANIVASKNYVVVSQIATNGSLTAKAERMTGKFTGYTKRKLRG